MAAFSQKAALSINYPFYLTATSLVCIPASALSIFALAKAIERRFFAPLNIKSTPP